MKKTIGKAPGAGAASPDSAVELTNRERALRNRETWIRAREQATGEHDARLAEREEVVRLREAALRARAAADASRAECEHVLVQAREANARLVVSSLLADELAATEATARHRAESLAEHLANTLPMLAWFAEPDGTAAWFNERWHAYTGTPLEEQQTGGWQSVLDPADVPRVIAGWNVALASSEPWEDVARLRRRDSELRWFLCRALPLRDSSGTLVRWFFTSIDIEEQKRTITHLTRLVDHLLEAAHPPASPVLGAHRHPCRVLMIDDDHDAAGLIASALEAHGYDVRVAHDGPSSFVIAPGFLPDVVLLDIGLPGMDGYEVAHNLREILSPREVHFIALTGYGQPRDRLYSKEAGFDAHLVKPATIAAIEDSISAATRSLTLEHAGRP